MYNRSIDLASRLGLNNIIKKIEKELTELKELVSKLLEIQIKEFEYKHKPPTDSIRKVNSKLVYISDKSNSS